MSMLTYPRRDASPAAVFTQRTFDLAHAHLMSWRQAAGAYGDLHLHACWGESSVLSRRYHGQSAYQAPARLRGFMRLHDHTRQPKWRLLADDVISNVLYLQTPAGGFYHASSEYEPTYRDDQTCPIHQGLPVLALLRYAAWPHADPMRVSLVRDAVDRHWRWFEKSWWKRGNAWKAPLDLPGFCGVTNQDLVIVAALAQYAVAFGDDSLYQRFGLPTLEAYLSPAYYHQAVGLFERGDRANFAERTTYYDVILPMLKAIQAARPHSRIPAVIDDVTRQIFAAAYVADDGLTHLSYGTDPLPPDKSRIPGWVRDPRPIGSYLGFIHLMREHLAAHPDAKRQAIHDGLERTVAAYTFADGTLPYALGGDPLFAVASRSEGLWLDLMDRLGDQLQPPAEVPVPVVDRTCGPVAFGSAEKVWRITRAGTVVFTGLKQNPGGIAVGEHDSVAGADLRPLDAPDVTERLPAPAES